MPGITQRRNAASLPIPHERLPGHPVRGGVVCGRLPTMNAWWLLGIALPALWASGLGLNLRFGGKVGLHEKVDYLFWADCSVYDAILLWWPNS